LTSKTIEQWRLSPSQIVLTASTPRLCTSDLPKKETIQLKLRPGYNIFKNRSRAIRITECFLSKLGAKDSQTCQSDIDGYYESQSFHKSSDESAKSRQYLSRPCKKLALEFQIQQYALAKSFFDAANTCCLNFVS